MLYVVMQVGTVCKETKFCDLIEIIGTMLIYQVCLAKSFLIINQLHYICLNFLMLTEEGQVFLNPVTPELIQKLQVHTYTKQLYVF